MINQFQRDRAIKSLIDLLPTPLQVTIIPGPAGRKITTCSIWLFDRSSGVVGVRIICIILLFRAVPARSVPTEAAKKKNG